MIWNGESHMRTLIELSEKLNSYLNVNPIFKCIPYILAFGVLWLVLYDFGFSIGDFMYSIVH